MGATRVLKSELDNEELLGRFLLGDLSESERALVEDRFLANEDFFQELLIGEDDLIDAYVRGELPAAERALFERCCLTTQHERQRVEFARTFYNSISGKTGTIANTREQGTTGSWWRSLFGKFVGGRPALSFTLAAALLVIALGGLWLLIERTRTRPATQQEQAGRTLTVQPSQPPTPMTAAEHSQPEKETPGPTPLETPKRTAVVVATYTLLPGTVRGEGGANSIVLPGGTTEVRLRLALEGVAYKKYRATLSTPEGAQLWSHLVTNRSSIKSDLLTLSLPTKLFKGSDYVLTVSGVNADGKWESVADYSFRVLKK
jgi:hypothetical protein